MNNTPQSELTDKETLIASRIARAVYRQLLDWCKRTGAVPLAGVLPPVHYKSPDEISAYRLEVLAQKAPDMGDKAIVRARELLPSHTEIKPHQLTLLIRNTADLKNLIQVMFRLNSGEAKPEHLKIRQAAAFNALKSLNELTDRLNSIEQERQSHCNRNGVQFCVGQVVQHKDERWRGVVGDWSRSRPNDEGNAEGGLSQKTSLTTKDYSMAFAENSTEQHASGNASNVESNDGNVFYNIILDAGDATSMGSPSGWTRCSQRDLEAVQDEHLMRIRSGHIPEKFARFDPESKLFVPTELHTHQYPKDQPQAKVVGDLSTPVQELCTDLVAGVQELASRMNRFVLDETSCPAERNLHVLSAVQERMRALKEGDVLSSEQKLVGGMDHISPLTLAAQHLRELLGIYLEIAEVNQKREASMKVKENIKYDVGDVVYHTYFGFRGVVVGWDEKPIFDVRHWDGLQHVDNPQDKPFYHIVPDENDCIEAFGAPRGVRYVCEDNLMDCPEGRRSIKVDLDVGWKRSDSDVYTAPHTLRYQYGSDPEDDGATERCLYRIQNEMYNWHLAAQSTTAEDVIAQKLSMANLYSLLQNVENQVDAYAVQETIKEMRKAHVQKETQSKLECGISFLVGGDGKEAMEVYKELVEDDPNYAEAWNRLATCQFMLGDNEASLESTKKALELEPNHVQALSGLGLIYFEEGEYKEAAQAFRKSAALDPWSLVATKLSLTVDLMNRVIFREELSN